MHRPPGKYDSWWAKHEVECGGTYTKIQEPAPTKKKIEAMSKKERAGRQKNKLDGWLKPKEKLNGSDKKPKSPEPPKKEDNTSSGVINGKRKAAAIS